jgi:pimeloyl-ACP methyl ester carboxylesterase
VTGQSRILPAWDGLDLHVREWGGGPAIPLLCLPGLVRSSGDFAHFAESHAEGRRIVAVDYPGRGRSGRATDIKRYTPEACLRDAGVAFLRGFVAEDPALPDLNAAAAYLRAKLPDLSLATDADWRRFAALTYEPGPDGRLHPSWDTRIAELVESPMRDLWPLFRALAHLRVLLVRGLRSNILLPDTVRKMLALRPDMSVVEIAGVGHAPTLAEPEAKRAIDSFLASP